MSIKDKKVILEFDEKMLEGLKHRTELIMRGNPQAGDSIIITVRDKIILDEYFEDFKTELQNELGITGNSESYEDGSLVIDFSERQQEEGLGTLSRMITQIAQEYLLMRWFDGLSLLDLSGYRRAVYEKLLQDYKHNSTQKSFVVPKYRPYF